MSRLRLYKCENCFVTTMSHNFWKSDHNYSLIYKTYNESDTLLGFICLDKKCVANLAFTIGYFDFKIHVKVAVAVKVAYPQIFTEISRLATHFWK